MLLASLCLSALAACGAREPTPPDPGLASATAPSCAVPRGWRWAVLAVLPDARVLEYDPAPAAADTPLLVAWWSEAALPPGYDDAGPWLRDSVWLAWRTDLGPTDEATDVEDPWTFLATVGGEDGPGRLAATPDMVQRLGLAVLPHPDSAAPPSLSSSASALELVMRRVHADDAAEALARGQCEAAWLDGPARARWQLVGNRWIDRVRLRPVAGTTRELRLAIRRGDPTALASARMLQAAQPLLKGLGYEPAD